MFIKTIRKRLKPIFWTLVALIVPGFMFWGVSSAVRTKKLSYVGKIFDKRVYYDEFKKTLSWLVVSKYTDNIHNIHKYPTIYEEAWKRLILLEEAKKKKIKVSDEELASYIRLMPYFQRDNRFDGAQYKYLLTYQFGIDRKLFEEEARKTLMIASLQQRIFNEFDPSDKAIKEEYFKANQSAKVAYVIFLSENFKGLVSATNDEIEEYYNENSYLLKKPEQVDVDYIRVPIKPFEEGIDPTDEEIKSYYEENKEEFEIREAKESEETYRPLEDVSYYITKRLIMKEADKKAYKLMDDISEALIDDPDMQKAADKFSFKLNKTGLFSIDDSIKNIGFSKEFSHTAFNLSDDEISQILKIRDGYYIIRLRLRRKPRIPTLDEVENEIQDILISQKAKLLTEESCASYLSKLRKMLSEPGTTFESACEALGLEVNSPDNYITKDSVIPKIGVAEAFSDTVFKLSKGDVSDPVKIGLGYCIIKVADKKLPNEEMFEKEKELFTKKIIFKKKLSHLKEWEEDLIEKADLQRNTERHQGD